MPVFLILIAILSTTLPSTNNAAAVNDVGSWWPYMLTLPAFLDIVLVAMIVYRERGPGGSLEHELFPCFPESMRPSVGMQRHASAKYGGPRA